MLFRVIVWCICVYKILKLLLISLMFPLGVTFVPANAKKPIRYLVTLNKQDKIIKLKEELIKCIGHDAPKNIALAEVLDSHIARILVSW